MKKLKRAVVTIAIGVAMFFLGHMLSQAMDKAAAKRQAWLADPTVKSYVAEGPQLRIDDFVTAWSPENVPVTYKVIHVNSDGGVVCEGVFGGTILHLEGGVDEAVKIKQSGRSLSFIRREANEVYWKKFQEENKKR